MLTALVDGHRREARPGLTGLCPGCGSTLIPKCGDLRAWHWAHHGERHCDPWWEESKWHTTWKDRFPIEWQEIVQQAQDGEKHIADVRTPSGRVIEFQHSPLAKEERSAREAFYKSMVWVVDGLARKRDLQKFKAALRVVCREPLVYSSDTVDCALLRDWRGRPVDVFFDFGEPILWHLHPNPEGRLILTAVAVAAFTKVLHCSIPFRRIRIATTQHTAFPALYRRRRRSKHRYVESFQQYWRSRERARSRF